MNDEPCIRMCTCTCTCYGWSGRVAASHLSVLELDMAYGTGHGVRIRVCDNVAMRKKD
jgi:hypothetical protein